MYSSVHNVHVHIYTHAHPQTHKERHASQQVICSIYSNDKY